MIISVFSVGNFLWLFIVLRSFDLFSFQNLCENHPTQRVFWFRNYS